MTTLHWPNRVKQAVSAGGTGALTIGAAVSGFASLGAADDGKKFRLVIEDGSAWEVSTGVYTHSGTSIARTLIESSTGSLLDVTTSATVMISKTNRDAMGDELAQRSVVPGGRLTLESGVPVSTSDQTAKTTLYYTPYLHNVIPLWDGDAWRPVEFAETSLALGTLTSGKPYDVFAYLSSGVLALELLAWTDDTTRATAVTRQDGRLCKSGDKTRLLVGTIYTTSTTTTEDSLANRYVWNLHNQVLRRGKGATGASHTMAGSQADREWNGGTSAPRANFVVGVDQTVEGRATFRIAAIGVTFNIAWRLAIDTTAFGGGYNNFATASNSLTDITVRDDGWANAAPGKHFIGIRENNNSGSTSPTLDQGAVDLAFWA